MGLRERGHARATSFAWFTATSIADADVTSHGLAHTLRQHKMRGDLGPWHDKEDGLLRLLQILFTSRDNCYQRPHLDVH